MKMSKSELCLWTTVVILVSFLLGASVGESNTKDKYADDMQELIDRRRITEFMVEAQAVRWCELMNKEVALGERDMDFKPTGKE